MEGSQWDNEQMPKPAHHERISVECRRLLVLLGCLANCLGIFNRELPTRMGTGGGMAAVQASLDVMLR
jgi:hypothetical protein